MNTYTFIKCTREQSVCSRSRRQKLGVTFSQLPSRYQKQCKSYFVKRLQTSKLLGNRRNPYILDAICNRVYFGEIHEEVLGQCSGQGTSQHPEQNVYLYISGLFEKKNKRDGSGNVLVQTPLKFLGLSSKFWKNQGP